MPGLIHLPFLRLVSRLQLIMCNHPEPGSCRCYLSRCVYSDQPGAFRHAGMRDPNLERGEEQKSGTGCKGQTAENEDVCACGFVGCDKRSQNEG